MQSCSTFKNMFLSISLIVFVWGPGISRGALQSAGGTFNFSLAYLIRHSTTQEISLSVM